MRSLLAPVVLLIVAGCGAPPTLKRVETEVFTKSCIFSSCHSASAPAEGLNLESPTHAKIVGVKGHATGSASLTLVVPGKPDESYLYQKLTKTMPAAGALMPQTGDMLEASRLALVHDWIAAGAENN